MSIESDIAGYREILALQAEARIRMPRSPMCFGWRTYSQCDEDGIIRHITSIMEGRKIGTKTFIEIGCGNGLENNTHQLLLDGYRGIWVDASKEHIQEMLGEFGAAQVRDRLLIKHLFVDLDNLMDIVEASTSFLGVRDCDVFSLDIDGNDFHICAEFIKYCRPRLLCLEYNAKFPPPAALIFPYSPRSGWDGSDFFGASLQAWVDLLSDYMLVACSVEGANAFFVRRDFAVDFVPYPILSIYQPPRYHLASLPIGHRASLGWLKSALTGEEAVAESMICLAAEHQSVGPFPIWAHSTEDVYITASIRSTRCWEPFESLLFHDVINPGDIVLDIGANIGWYTLIGAKRLCDSGRIHAFEPDEDNFRILQRNLRSIENGSRIASAYKIAIGEGLSIGQLYLSDEGNQGDHRMFQDGTSRNARKTVIDSLDNFFTLQSSWPRVVKSDTQGSEMHILAGASKMLAAGWRPVFILEFWPFGLSIAGKDHLTLYNLLIGFGYKIFHIDEDIGRLMPFESAVLHRLSTDVSVESKGHVNIMAFPESFFLGGNERFIQRHLGPA